MKKELLLLLAMTLLVCTAMSQTDFSIDSSKEKIVADKWDAKKVYDNFAIKEKEKFDMNYDKDGKKCFDKCYEKCFYTQKCHKCGDEHRFDSYCDKCG